MFQRLNNLYLSGDNMNKRERLEFVVGKNLLKDIENKHGKYIYVGCNMWLPEEDVEKIRKIKIKK